MSSNTATGRVPSVASPITAYHDSLFAGTTWHKEMVATISTEQALCVSSSSSAWLVLQSKAFGILVGSVARYEREAHLLMRYFRCLSRTEHGQGIGHIGTVFPSSTYVVLPWVVTSDKLLYYVGSVRRVVLPSSTSYAFVPVR